MATERSYKLDTDDARQGETGHNVRYVLASGLVLGLAAYVAVMWWWFGSLSPL